MEERLMLQSDFEELLSDMGANILSYSSTYITVLHNGVSTTFDIIELDGKTYIPFIQIEDFMIANDYTKVYENDYSATFEHSVTKTAHIMQLISGTVKK